MADTITRVEHYTAPIADQPGAGAKVLSALQAGGADLIGLWGYPMGSGQANLELVPKNGAALRRAARKAGVNISPKQTAVLVQGKDRPGALAGIMGKLGAAGINVHAVQAACAGGGKFGAILYFLPADVRKAARVLGAK